jgi:hypothetical protein
MKEIQRGDPSARRKAVTILVVGAIAGVTLLVVAGAVRPDLEAWLKEDLRGRSRIVLGAIAVLMAGPLLALAAYLWRLGGRVVATGRFPPSGTRLVRDTPVVTGGAAARAGRVLQSCAVALAAAAVLLTVFIWQIAALLTQ